MFMGKKWRSIFQTLIEVACAWWFASDFHFFLHIFLFSNLWHHICIALRQYHCARFSSTYKKTISLRFKKKKEKEISINHLIKILSSIYKGQERQRINHEPSCPEEKIIYSWQSEKARSYTVRSTQNSQNNSSVQVFSWILESVVREKHFSCPALIYFPCLQSTMSHNLVTLTLCSRAFCLDQKQ